MQFPASSVRDLARLLESANLGEISLESEGDRLTLKRAAPPSFVYSPEVASASPVLDESESVAFEETNVPTVAPSENKVVVSDWVGVFRDAKKPVEVGAAVKKGQHLGAVESLKVPFDIIAPSAGTIESICVVNGQGVEWGQTLFEITPEK